MVLKYMLYRVYSKLFDIDPCKMVIVVRKDISMTPGKVASQCAHAAVECYRNSSNSSSTARLCKEWILAGQPKIILKTYSEEELKKMYKKANDTGLTTAIIRDAGSTQVASGTVTTVGIGPARRKDIDEITSHLKIY